MKFEYPWIFYVNKDIELFETTTMFDLSFDTKIHYFKNHELDITYLVIKLFGFGIRYDSRD